MEKEANSWDAKQSEDYYGLRRWGGGHFSADEKGFVCAHPAGDGRRIQLMEVIEEAMESGLKPPMTIRIQDLLRHRVELLAGAFANAIEGEKYAGRYRGVFPIKVNQLREVVEEIRDAGEPLGFGLEAGSKPELLIALALSEKAGSLLICNGYKDPAYIRLALLGTQLGREVILVVEQPSEADAIIKVAQEIGVTPKLGIRLKLHSNGEGKWKNSSGDDAKFGLSISEVMTVLKKLQKARLSDALKLIHFHIGSQVTDILAIKRAVVEAARYYCELRKLGHPIQYLDVGGGLGIDYDGSRSNFESSMNYSLPEYARDVVFNIKKVCEQAEVPEPDILSESGRALVAPHSVLVLEVVDRIAKVPEGPLPRKTKRTNHVIKDLLYTLEESKKHSQLERFHDAQQKRAEAESLFTHGYLDLKNTAIAEELYWRICDDIRQNLKRDGYIPEELEDLDTLLAEQYVCNFSVFQSLLDHWALGQLFPVAPLHRLQEEPTTEATLVDITCDSDGKIAKFTDLEDVRPTLRLHPVEPGKPYYLGVFLVGAYQDIMGDLHNLFGRVNEVHVFLEDDEENGFYIEETIDGFSTNEILDLIQYKESDLMRRMKTQIDTAIKNDTVKPREGVRLLNLFSEQLKAKTYLDTSSSKTRTRRNKAR
ncbi:biosynthetic arginine decarboxylase [Rubellicoccus peritrichatus]|uniref:Arginine decarboxylase n=1 Tax=Rubellicoccus peritrichatus TaxID=3080537 RepID=A0AAQ3LAU5_9BACT|nr:biosynthetic arginine decarboxylase [Puniceicoccus sp. CR14]WOO40108.1 biosynthetic arginine decarboxylase [Puniceicoccus sp. CR14]